MSIFNNWIILGLISALGYGFGTFSLFSLDKLTKRNLNGLAISSVFYIFIVLYGVIIYYYQSKKGRDDKPGIFKGYIKGFKQVYQKNSNIMLVITIGICYVFGNLLMYSAYPISPNPGYVDSLAGIQMAITTILTFFIYKGIHLHFVNCFGLFLMIFAGYLIAS